MTIKRQILTLALLLPAIPNLMPAWGGVGHKTVAAIAETNLTPEARAGIKKYLRNESLVDCCLWMDQQRKLEQQRKSDEYKRTHRLSHWHSAMVDANFKHTAEGRPDEGDGITMLDKAIAGLRDRKDLPADLASVHIKVIVHLLGDMHCPVHVRYATSPSPNHKVSNGKIDFKLTIRGKELGHHGVWDTNIPNWATARHNQDYAKWARELGRLNRDEIARITTGTHLDWFLGTARDTHHVYDWVTPGIKMEDKAFEDFRDKAVPLAASQIQKAGYRLAKVLNDCFAQ